MVRSKCGKLNFLFFQAFSTVFQTARRALPQPADRQCASPKRLGTVRSLWEKMVKEGGDTNNFIDFDGGNPWILIGGIIIVLSLFAPVSEPLSPPAPRKKAKHLHIRTHCHA